MGDKYFKNKYKIDSTRLKYWDYSNPGYYFVTLCVKEKVCSFGDIKNGMMCLSDIGRVAYNCWLEIPKHFPFVELYDFVVMPNHVHGIVFIGNDGIVETQYFASPYNTPNHTNTKYVSKNTNKGSGKIIGGEPETHVGGEPETQNIASLQQNKNYKNKFGPQSNNLSSIIRGFKIGVTKYATINKIPFLWQPRFHDHIIRNEYEMGRIQNYILENPTNWEKDIFYFNS